MPKCRPGQLWWANLPNERCTHEERPALVLVVDGDGSEVVAFLAPGTGTGREGYPTVMIPRNTVRGLYKDTYLYLDDDSVLVVRESDLLELIGYLPKAYIQRVREMLANIGADDILGQFPES